MGDGKAGKAAAGSAAMRTVMPNPRRSPRYAGVCTFFRFPLLEAVAKDHQPMDWVAYGVPFDSGVTYRPGARFGPRAIREESQYVKPYHLEHDLNVAERLSCADGGDAPVLPYDLKGSLEGVTEFARGLGDSQKTRLLAFGGDHSIAYANIKATWERGGKPKGGLALVHFDAHLDTVDEIAGSQWSHGSPFRRAQEDGLIDMKRMLSIGIRGPMNRADDLDFARDNGATIVTADEARTGRGARAIQDFIGRLDGAETYLTFDVDCVDPAFAPGTGTPVCGGFTSAEALAMLKGCAGINVVGADVVEVLPDRDFSGITALLAAHVGMEVLALAARAQALRAS